MKWFRYFCFFLTFYLLPQLLLAQQWLGVAGSNYAGTYSVGNNPANVVDSRYKLFVNLVGNDLFVFNNYVSWNAPYSIFSLITRTASAQYQAPNGNTIWKDSYLAEDNSNTPKNAHILGDLKAVSILFNINSNNAISLNSRVRYGASIDNTSTTLAKLIRNGFEQKDLLNNPVNGENFAFNLNAYTELSATYGRVIINDDDRFVKIGITAKRLVGMYNVHALVTHADYQLITNPNDPTKNALNVDKIDVVYGATADAAWSQIRPTPSWVLGSSSPGGGWAADIGMVYEFRPDARKFLYTDKGVRQFDRSKNKYAWKVGVSLVDIGFLKYDNVALKNQYQVLRANRLIAASDYIGVGNNDQAIAATNNTLLTTENERIVGYQVGIPTNFQVNFDYHVRDNWYVNTLWVQGLKPTQSIGMTMPSLFSVTPRYETRWFEAAMPVALLNNYQNFTVGLSTRVGPLWIGTDHLGSWLGFGKPSGADLYFGLFVPILYRSPRAADACWYEENRKVKKRKRH